MSKFPNVIHQCPGLPSSSASDDSDSRATSGDSCKDSFILLCLQRINGRYQQAYK